MPNKTMLRTEFVKIGTSGSTVDGREIPPSAIQEMADSYDPDEYTAVINYEHYSWAGNFGTVLELKAEKNKKGEMVLLAVLAPNKHMLNLNADGQKLFTSMEVISNFAGTGKAYLSALALTDTPASRGTTQLNFSHRVKKENLLSDPQELQLNMQPEEEKPPGWFTKFLDSFKTTAAVAATDPQEDDDMTPEQLAALTDSINKTIDEKFAALQPAEAAPSGDGEDPAPGTNEPGAAVFSAEEATQLTNTVADLANQVATINDTLEKLSKTPTGEPTPTPTGDVEKPVY